MFFIASCKIKIHINPKIAFYRMAQSGIQISSRLSYNNTKRPNEHQCGTHVIAIRVAAKGQNMRKECYIHKREIKIIFLPFFGSLTLSMI
jgi:hypothetical protein